MKQEEEIRLYNMLFMEFSKHCNDIGEPKTPKNYILFIKDYFEKLEIEVNKLQEKYENSKK